MGDFSKQDQSAPYTNAAQAAAAAFVAREHGLLIAGLQGSAADGARFPVIDPATGEEVASCAAGKAVDVDRAVAAALRAFADPAWSGMLPEARAALLHAIADALEDHAEELAAIQSSDLGTTPALSRALVAGGIEAFRYYAGWPTKIAGETLPANGASLTWTMREPLGVIGAIIPWNGPAQAGAWKIAPALACGNTVVFKPASEAPLVSIRMLELMIEAGLPEGAVNLVTGAGGEAGQALIEHPEVAKITFTGSTEVGKSLMATAAATLKKVTLELGGKSPTILFADADLDHAVPAATMGFCAGAGQGCVAGSRILVEDSIHDEVVERVAAAAAKMKVGSAGEAGVEIPPIVSERQLKRIVGFIEKGRAEGARLVTGGGVRSGPGYFVEPTVFADVSPTMTIAREEIFGPVVVIMRFADEAEAIRLANDTDYGLSASVWTRDVSRMHRMISAVQAGTVWGNTLFEIDTKAPFGGYKQSGLGRELGPDSIEAFTQVKTAMIRFG